jgi:hypothetical protein
LKALLLKLVYWAWGLTILVVTLVCCVASSIALAFPEHAARLGYTNGCNSCHVSPTGGGSLTAYGRSTAEELATIPRPGAGRFFGLDQPDWLATGGDTRHVNINAPGFHRKLWMQSDFELGLQPSSEVWLVGSAGYYGEERKLESRRSYLLWTPSKYVSLRIGKFFPAFGLLIPDHTVATRSGLGFREGEETYNAEIRLHNTLFDLFVSALFGKEWQLGVNEDHIEGKARDAGVATRLTAAVTKTMQVGASHRYLASVERLEHTAGAFWNLGITRDLYLLAEADRVLTFPRGDYASHRDVAMAELGYEFARGLHIQGTYEFEQTNRWGYGLQWFPLPHVELNSRAKSQDGLWQSVLMTHLYF